MTDAKMHRSGRWPESRSDRMNPASSTGFDANDGNSVFQKWSIKPVDKAQKCGNILQLLRLQYDVGPDIGRGCW
jgi:hypothetical protein